MSSTPDSSAPAPLALDFTPVSVRARRDGWTAERQAAFIAVLREGRCVLAACRRVGKSSESAYKLYRRPSAASFRRAWDAALAGAPLAPSTSACRRPRLVAARHDVRHRRFARRLSATLGFLDIVNFRAAPDGDEWHVSGS
jgi:hypothetical protein